MNEELKVMEGAFLEELGQIGLAKQANELTPESRSHIANKNFAVSAKASNTGKPAYPIPDKQHAISALGFAKMHHDSKDLAEVRKDVAAKYPSLVKKKEAFASEVKRLLSKEAGALQAIGQKLAPLAGEAATHSAELAGLGVLAAPSVDEMQAHVRAGLAGKSGEHEVQKRQLLPSVTKPATELAGLGILAGPSLAHKLMHT